MTFMCLSKQILSSLVLSEYIEKVKILILVIIFVYFIVDRLLQVH